MDGRITISATHFPSLDSRVQLVLFIKSGWLVESIFYANRTVKSALWKLDLADFAGIAG